MGATTAPMARRVAPASCCWTSCAAPGAFGDTSSPTAGRSTTCTPARRHGPMAPRARPLPSGGCDLECGQTFEHLGEALDRGLLSEGDIDRAVTRIYTTRLQTGHVRPAGNGALCEHSESVINSDAHRQLAYEAALKSVVLLKNAGDILPLRDLRSLYVLGRPRPVPRCLMGNYYGFGFADHTHPRASWRAPEGVRFRYRPGTLLLHRAGWPAQWTTMAAARLRRGDCLHGSLAADGGARKATPSSRPPPAIAPRSGCLQLQADHLRELKANGSRGSCSPAAAPSPLGDIADLADAILFVCIRGRRAVRAVADILFGVASLRSCRSPSRARWISFRPSRSTAWPDAPIATPRRRRSSPSALAWATPLCLPWRAGV